MQKNIDIIDEALEEKEAQDQLQREKAKAEAQAGFQAFVWGFVLSSGPLGGDERGYTTLNKVEDFHPQHVGAFELPGKYSSSFCRPSAEASRELLGGNSSLSCFVGRLAAKSSLS